MSYQRMTLVERMDIFRLLYVEKRKHSDLAASLNRAHSSITRELEKGAATVCISPYSTEPGILNNEGISAPP